MDGLITSQSPHSAAQTRLRLVAGIQSRGLTLFATIDHAKGAAEVGLPLRPTEVLLFGHARGGTPLMQAGQTSGIDLPLKLLVWEDAAGACQVSYNDPGWIGRRHRIEGVEPVIGALRHLLEGLVAAAIKP